MTALTAEAELDFFVCRRIDQQHEDCVGELWNVENEWHSFDAEVST